MHWIQQSILIELTRYSQRRYSQLRPDGVEGNLFLYHLDGLVRDGLVEKASGAYQLTVKGLRHVATLSLATGKQRRQPQLLTAVICHNEVGELLFVRWRREPNRGLISLPHGMVHYGRSLTDMAALELAEKAGLVGKLGHLGEVTVRAYQGQEVDRHMIIQVFEAMDVHPGRVDELRSDSAEAFWARLEALQGADFVPGFYEIAQMAVGSEPFPRLAEVSVGILEP